MHTACGAHRARSASRLPTARVDSFGLGAEMSTLAVVEDNADNRLLLDAILGDQYDLIEYENGADALSGFERSRPDLVLLDIALPGMDGNEILRRIRDDARLRDVPVIALTAHAMAWDREKFLS